MRRLCCDCALRLEESRVEILRLSMHYLFRHATLFVGTSTSSLAGPSHLQEWTPHQFTEDEVTQPT
ncbi:hypothetical protein J6590_063355 [Homalodisca vitripennis]|nr:hypothetical protein J6590_063355 [Homalodisca vitripennis]